MSRNYPPPEEVKLWVFDVLKFMVENPNQEYTEAELKEIFELEEGFRGVYKKLRRLNKWGMVKIRRNSNPKVYSVTKWGIKYLADREKEEEV